MHIERTANRYILAHIGFNLNKYFNFTQKNTSLLLMWIQLAQEVEFNGIQIQFIVPNITLMPM